jgi:hypothetical protein
LFNNRYSKYIHIKKGKCVAPLAPHPTTINNNYNINNINNINNNITNNNNIVINIFGKESLEYFENHKNLLNLIRSYAKKKTHAMTEIIVDIYCNPLTPKNNTIMKPNRYGNDVLVMGNRGIWEHRFIKDIRVDFLQHISKVMQLYNTKRNELKYTFDKYANMKEFFLLKEFVQKLNNIDVEIADDMFDELGIVDENDFHKKEDKEAFVNQLNKDINEILQNFDKSTLQAIHAFTRLRFIQDNDSNFVRKGITI